MAEAAKSLTGAADSAALEIFQNQWEVYSKFLRHDYLSNGKAAQVMHHFLRQEVERPFKFLDLACGDASASARALTGMLVESYRGVDLSAPALEAAKRNLAALSCPVALDEADFTTALDNKAAHEDVVWISLSLHHLATAEKLEFMRKVRSSLADDGAFLIYEPTCRDGESRNAYLDRCETVARRDWAELTAFELAESMKHIRGCDFPETASDWVGLGSEAGFARASELYAAPTDLFRLFLYRI